jgi:hypothetical protein
MAALNYVVALVTVTVLSLTLQELGRLGGVPSRGPRWRTSRPASSWWAAPLPGEIDRSRGGAWLDRRGNRGDQSGKGA